MCSFIGAGLFVVTLFQPTLSHPFTANASSLCHNTFLHWKKVMKESLCMHYTTETCKKSGCEVSETICLYTHLSELCGGGEKGMRKLFRIMLCLHVQVKLKTVHGK